MASRNLPARALSLNPCSNPTFLALNGATIPNSVSRTYTNCLISKFIRLNFLSSHRFLYLNTKNDHRFLSLKLCAKPLYAICEAKFTLHCHSSLPNPNILYLVSWNFSNQNFLKCKNSSFIPIILRGFYRKLPGLRTLYRRWESDELSDDTGDFKFDRAVLLFNSRDYYQCHDILEAIWNRVEEPQRTIVHGLLQCAVGLYHLANQNHRGAMMELGEGRCKLRKMNFRSGPFQQFEKEISAVLDFIYETQLELAACKLKAIQLLFCV